MLTLELYQYNGKFNVVSKVLDNSTAQTVNGVIFGDFDLIKPSVKIRTNQTLQDLRPFNYALLDGKFYFVENIVILATDVYKLDLRLDVLTTYQTQIKAATATVINRENANGYISNRETIFNVLPSIQKLTFSENTPFDVDGNIIMVALKGKL